MRNKLKFILLSCLLLAAALLATSCSRDLSPFKDFDKDGYTVSVKYDANGGVFTTNTETIVDTYSLSEYKTNSEGNKELKLFAPESESRGNQAYNAMKTGFYLAGWYTERIENRDGDGNVFYTYNGYWDFDKDRLSVKADEKYTSEEAVITLYAAWVPAFTYEFYTFDDKGNPVLTGTTTLSPLDDTTLTLPAYDAASGKVNVSKDFPKLIDKTYDKVYTDKDKTNELTAPTFTHSGKFVKETATLENPVMKLYCTATDGVTYRITTPEQLISSPDLSGNYIIEADLDFTGKYWPTLFATGEFRGKIIGGGHTIKNVKATQNNTDNTCFGLFGKISASATVTDITFESINIALKGYSKQNNASFGILAGEIATDATVSGITLKNSNLEIEKGSKLSYSVGAKAPKFGLVCAVGPVSAVTFSASDVTFSFSGEDSTEYTATPDSHGQFIIEKVQAN